MAEFFKVGIYSSTEVLYDGQAVSLVAPSESGYLGVLANHAPLAAKLVFGKITLRLPTGMIKVIESSPGGFLEVLQNQVTILL